MQKIASAFCLMLIGLSNVWGGGLTFDNSDKTGNDCVKKIITAIEEKNENLLKSLFSKSVVNGNLTFHEDANYIFNLCQGKKYVFNKIRSSAGGRVHEGKRMLQMQYWYSLESTDKTYLLFFIFNKVDDDNPGNVGIYSLRIIKKSDEKKYFTYMEDMCIPGIFNPARTEKQ